MSAEQAVAGGGGISGDNAVASGGGLANTAAAARFAARFWRAGAGALSGVLFALTMPPREMEWLVWIAFVPVLAALWARPAPQAPAPSRQQSGRNAGRLAGAVARLASSVWGLRRHLPPAPGYVFGLVFFLISMRWISTVSGIGWILISCYLALYPWAWGWFAARFSPARLSASPYLFSRHNLFAAGMAAAAWTASEYLRSILLTGFGWNTAAIALHNNLPLVQIAEFTGALGPSFIVLFVNAILLATFRRFWEEALRGKVRAHFDFTLTMAGVVAVFLFGAARLQNPPPDKEFLRIKVAAIQTNIPLAQQRDRAFIPELLEIHRGLTAAAAAGRPDLIVWPEASVPGGILLHWDTRDFIESVMEGGGFALMHGTLDGDPNGDYNAVALRDAAGGDWQIHHKIHLVPFGEFFPFRSVFERFFPLVAGIVGRLIPGDFTPGKRWTLFDPGVPGVRIGPLICFEDTLGDLTRRFVLRGANLLVNVTNDAWFLESPASRQHMAAARFRAIENRRPLVRAANTGVTCFIDIFGRARLLESPEGTTFIRGYLSGGVLVPKPGAPLTFYSRHGEIFPMICLCLTFIPLAVQLSRHARRAAAAVRRGSGAPTHA